MQNKKDKGANLNNHLLHLLTLGIIKIHQEPAWCPISSLSQKRDDVGTNIFKFYLIFSLFCKLVTSLLTTFIVKTATSYMLKQKTNEPFLKLGVF